MKLDTLNSVSMTSNPKSWVTLSYKWQLLTRLYSSQWARDLLQVGLTLKLRDRVITLWNNVFTQLTGGSLRGTQTSSTVDWMTSYLLIPMKYTPKYKRSWMCRPNAEGRKHTVIGTKHFYFSFFKKVLETQMWAIWSFQMSKEDSWRSAWGWGWRDIPFKLILLSILLFLHNCKRSI